ncbi:MAG TPA: hypothetical protein VGA95_08710, partial [Thermodesulfobacteriota bacterium]
ISSRDRQEIATRESILSTSIILSTGPSTVLRTGCSKYDDKKEEIASREPVLTMSINLVQSRNSGTQGSNLLLTSFKK